MCLVSSTRRKDSRVGDFLTSSFTDRVNMVSRLYWQALSGYVTSHGNHTALEEGMPLIQHRWFYVCTYPGC